MRTDKQLLLAALATFVAAQDVGDIDLDDIDIGDLDDIDLGDIDLGDIDVGDIDISKECMSVVSDVLPEFTDAPVPDRSVMRALAEQTAQPTDPCEWPQITGPAAKDYTSYVEELASWYSGKEDIFSSVIDACADDQDGAIESMLGSCTEVKWATQTGEATTDATTDATTVTTPEGTGVTTPASPTPTTTGGSGGGNGGNGGNGGDDNGDDGDDSGNGGDDEEGEGDDGDGNAATRVTGITFAAVAAAFGMGAALL